MRKLLSTTLLTGLLATAVTGCGEDEKASESTAAQTAEATETETTETEATETETETSSEPGKPPAVKGSVGKKPEIAKPEGSPPEELVVKDIKKGKGKTATDGKAVTVQYVGVSWSTGEEFDASWNSGEPFTFSLGAGEVIEGWDKGVKGMKVGGRRELVIPAEFAYGEQGQPPSIAPNETLVFVVDLEEVN